MRLKVATYNIHKAVGTDGKRDPERILSVLRELDADVVALQEADRRFRERESVLPRSLLAEHHWQVVPVALRAQSIGWHGNAMLVRSDIEVLDCARIELPTLEPRGAIIARLAVGEDVLCVGGMHLDLSGMLRRHQIAAICDAMAGAGSSAGSHAIMMGDLNEWSRERGALRSFPAKWKVLAPGRSFPSRRPLAMLDRIIHSAGLICEEAGIHHSALAARASDHLPAWASLRG